MRNRPTKEERDAAVDLVRARELEERDYARVGIPARFWDTLLKDLAFQQCNFDTSPSATLKKPRASKKLTTARCTIPPHQQRQQLKQLIKEPSGQLVVLGSWPTDEGALAASSSALVQCRQEGYTVRFVNARYTREKLPGNTAAYCVHNILQDCTSERLEAVRDLLLRWRRPARIVVVAGCQDPLTFCMNRLCLKPDMVGLIKDPA